MTPQGALGRSARGEITPRAVGGEYRVRVRPKWPRWPIRVALGLGVKVPRCLCGSLATREATRDPKMNIGDILPDDF